MCPEILEYLNKPNPDFDAGFSLFCKYSVNQSLMSWIGRKHDMDRLLYELKKLSVISLRRLNPQATAHVIRYNRSLPAGYVPRIPAAGVQPKITFKTYDERRTRRADLPPELQKVYDDIAEDYKLRRGYHEKMKMSQTDKDRAQLRERMLICQRHIEEGWKKIDSYLAAAPAQSSDFNEKTYRAYISKMLKKNQVTDVQAATIKARVISLQEHGCNISDSTITAIKARGWI